MKLFNDIALSVLVSLVLVPAEMTSQCGTVNVEITGETAFCAGDSTTLMVADTFVSYQWGLGNTSNQLTTSIPGVYCITVTDAMGCTGVACITVTDIPPVTTVLNVEMCEDEWVFCHPFCPCDQELFCVDTIPNQFGCDSIIVVDVVIVPTAIGEVTYSGCSGDGYSVVVSGTTYDESNPFGIETFIAADGCDSVVTVNLYFNPSSTGTLTFELCQEEWEECQPNCECMLYPECNVTLLNQYGCDSIVTINIIVDPNPTTTISEVLCLGDTLTINGTNYTQSGTYTQEFSTNGCDSIVIITLITEPVIQLTSIDPDNGTGSGAIHLFDAPGNSTYLWSNGQTGASATGLSDGVYTVTVTGSGGCTAEETFEVPFAIPINPAAESKPFSAHPNPGSGSVTFDIPGTLQYGRLEVLDLTGKTIYHTELTGQSQIHADLTRHSGVYLALLSNGGTILHTQKLIIR